MENKKEDSIIPYSPNFFIVAISFYTILFWHFTESNAQVVGKWIERIMSGESASMEALMFKIVLLSVLYYVAITLYAVVYFGIGFLLRHFLCRGKNFRLIVLILLIILSVIIGLLFELDLKYAIRNI
ncbi:hypothetical protein [Myroides marinus]|uniref:Uncharacterized protein n=1 Tax=Myroides marinus TaxID=703342 RepID=A0A161SDJ3_9FLAO|nr:hypothetical protein [Myroides marinus]KZE78705.1 hypothetical protein AV926_12050 [Myroides marinus]MDM1346251.1 hypothetical protein [Myroides marinus]MDM1379204.1 hypothetical protein [Myroides marinus]MDM1386467.1 hypothetical protein [Myroides marinus]MDM1393688.1 hypothetical protein [Myroides marinus]